MKNIFKIFGGFLIIAIAFSSCNNGSSSQSNGALTSGAAEKVYVAPGEYDELPVVPLPDKSERLLQQDRSHLTRFPCRFHQISPT